MSLSLSHELIVPIFIMSWVKFGPILYEASRH